MKLFQMEKATQSHSADSFADNDKGTLQYVWATEGNLARAVHVMRTEMDSAAATKNVQRKPVEVQAALAPETAFYRSYTEGMLRRYAVLSMEGGRVSSLLGKEMFRGKVTSYRVHGFDDVVIFVHDVEQCFKVLTKEQQRLILRIGVQEYTFGEVAAKLGCSIRSVQRHYAEALDELTAVFLSRRLLEKIETGACQGSGSSIKLVSHCPR